MHHCATNDVESWHIVESSLWNMGVDVPQFAVRAVLKEHAKWHQQQEKRHTPKYLKTKYIIYFSTDITIPTSYHIHNLAYMGASSSRCRTKGMRRKRITWLHCKVLVSPLPLTALTKHWRDIDSRPEGDMAEAEEDLFKDEEVVSLLPADSSTTDPILDNGKPLLFFYDCETTGGSHLRDHIIEVGSAVKIPEEASIITAKFSSLCHTSRHIVHQGLVLQTLN